MIGLTKKHLRYLSVLFAGVSLLFIFILLGDSITVPGIKDIASYFNPTGDEYVIDIEIVECSIFCRTSNCCRAPLSNKGKGGDLAKGTRGDWRQLEKDLALGSSWTRKQYLQYKTIKQDALDQLPAAVTESLVVVDIVISHKRPAITSMSGTLESLFKVSKDNSAKVPGKEITEEGWIQKSHGIWLKYGPPSLEAVSSVDVLFGGDAVDPRPNWRLLEKLKGTLSPSGREARLTYRRGVRVDYRSQYPKKLKFNSMGKFKILQVSDLHFGTGLGKCRDPVPKDIKGCEADPRTLEYLEKILDLENPDFVVLTGDQDFGERSPDPQTAIFKVLDPFIKRKIPFAVTLGNHDDETYLSRNDTLGLSIDLPYSLTERGPEDIDGFGNYVLNIEASDSLMSAFTMYFLDSHSHTANPKVLGNWDWIKENQLRWVEHQYELVKPMMDIYHHKYMSMAFFHIPIPEFGNMNQAYVGTYLEPPAGPRHNSGTRGVLGKAKVSVASIGHDHMNDYCLRDSLDADTMWLCYGGGAGEAGYGGKDYIRRVRLWEIDTVEGEIKSWKRAQNSPEEKFDEQVLVREGQILT